MCPGRTGKKCGVFMSPLIRDPHIHCPRCRGNKCTIDNTCIICKSWPPEQWELFAKKKSYAHSKARRGRSVSLSASPAPSVVGTSVGRPSVPPASPPPSRDQVVMGGQPSVGVSVGCVGSSPSGSVTMATGYVSDDVAASPVPPPASGGEGGQERLPPACSPIPGLSSTRLPSPIKRVKRVDTSGSAHSGPSRSPSTRESGEGSGAVSVFVLPHGIAPAPLLESVEVEVRVFASSLESDVTATVTWSDLAALAHPPRLRNHPTSTPALAIFITNAPVIDETRASIAHAILGNAPSTARGLGSAPTAPELLRSEAVSRDAVTRAAHRLLRRRSVLKSVPFVT